MLHRREKIVDLLFPVDEDADDALNLLWRLLEPRFEIVIERFYGHPAIVEMFEMIGAPLSEDLRRRQVLHWQRVFTLRTNQHYRDYCNHVARAHRTIGLPASLYVGAYTILAGLIMTEVATTFDLPAELVDRLRRALMRGVMEDVVLTLGCYETQEID